METSNNPTTVTGLLARAEDWRAGLTAWRQEKLRPLTRDEKLIWGEFSFKKRQLSYRKEITIMFLVLPNGLTANII